MVAWWLVKSGRAAARRKSGASFGRRRAVAGFLEPAKLGAQRFEATQIAFEDGMALHAILQAAKVCLQFRRPALGQGIDHPILVPGDLREAALAQKTEVLGNFHLRFVEQLLEMADAKRAVRQHVQDAQPRLVAEALVDLNE